MLLQQKAYSQLTGNKKIADKDTASMDSQLYELEKAAKGKIVLVVLDDVCKYSCYLYHAEFVTSSCRGHQVCKPLFLCRSRK